MLFRSGELEKPERIERRQRLHPGWTHDPEYPTFPFPVDSRKGMAVFLEITEGQISKVRWQPTMINKKSQPRLLRRSEPEFDDVLAYMRKITASQKMATHYEIDADQVITAASVS